MRSTRIGSPPTLKKVVEGDGDNDEQESKDQRLVLFPPNPNPLSQSDWFLGLRDLSHELAS